MVKLGVIDVLALAALLVVLEALLSLELTIRFDVVDFLVCLVGLLDLGHLEVLKSLAKLILDAIVARHEGLFKVLDTVVN